jgi:hypothetical protein
VIFPESKCLESSEIKNDVELQGKNTIILHKISDDGTIPLALLSKYPNITKVKAIDVKLKHLLGSFRSHLQTIKYLYLSDNLLESIENWAFSRLNILEKLIIKNNEIKKLGKNAFEGLAKLEILDLSQNHIKDLPFELLRPLSSLKTLKINDNFLSVLELEIFRGTKISTLELQNNKIHTIYDANEVLFIKRLILRNNNLISASFLMKLVHLEELDLSDNQNIRLDKQTFKENSDLLELFLKNVNLAQLKDILYHLFVFAISLQHLDLGNNDLTTFNIAKMSNNIHLLILNLDHNNLKEIDFKILPQKYPKLKNISITANEWNSTFAEEMANYFKSMHIACDLATSTQEKENSEKFIFHMRIIFLTMASLTVVHISIMIYCRFFKAVGDEGEEVRTLNNYQLWQSDFHKVLRNLIVTYFLLR